MERGTVRDEPRRYLRWELFSGIYQRFYIDRDLTIGRDEDNDVILSDLSISSHHAIIGKDNDKIWIEDLGSTNGTLVNDIIVHKRYLEDNDILMIGYLKMSYSVEPPAPRSIDLTRGSHLSMSDLAGEDDWLIILPSLRPQIDYLSDILADKISERIMAPGAGKNFATAVNQSLLNALHHGNGGDPNKKVRCRFRLHDKQIAITIDDEGSGFAYQDCFKQLTIEKNRLDQGLSSIFYGADIIEYNPRGNQVVLVKKLLAPGQQLYPDKKAVTSKTRVPIPAQPALRRHFAVRYPRLAMKNVAFPLEVVVSSEALQFFPPQMEIKPVTAAPTQPANLVYIMVVCPGCICSPPGQELDINHPPLKMEFWLTPLGPGKTDRAAIHVCKDGKLRKIIKTPFVAFNAVIPKLLLFLAFFLPAFFILLDIPDLAVKEEIPALVHNLCILVKKLGGLTGCGIFMGVACLAASLILYLRLSPLLETAAIVHESITFE